MEELLKQLLADVQELKKNMKAIKAGQDRHDHKIDAIYQSVVRLEEGQPLDMNAILERIDLKLDNKDAEINVLNKRIFSLESDIERLTKQ